MVTPEDDLTAAVPVTGPDETDAPTALAPVGYDTAATELLDVRGVGDSAFSQTHQKDPIPAGIGAALDRFDATGLKLKGDLTGRSRSFSLAAPRTGTPRCAIRRASAHPTASSSSMTKTATPCR